eukprot:PhM_4_TR7547/c0_g1_i1/m.58618
MSRAPKGQTNKAALNAVPVDFKLFDTEFTKVYRVPPNQVIPTQGSAEYVDYENTPSWLRRSKGQQQGTRKPFFMCSEFERTQGTCEHGNQCHNIHAAVWNSHVKVQIIHVRRAETLGQHRTLDAGRTVTVHDRQSGVTEEYPSQCILQTKGSDDWLQCPGDTRRVYHCSHFYQHGMCTRGPQCTFFHAIKTTAPPPVATAPSPMSVTNTSSANIRSGATSPQDADVPANAHLGSPQEGGMGMGALFQLHSFPLDVPTPSVSTSSRTESASSPQHPGRVTSSVTVEEVPKCRSVVRQYRNDPYGADVISSPNSVCLDNNQ